jgi:O-acetyl-ADP-ribose deacetylase (regulator of RNase III)
MIRYIENNNIFDSKADAFVNPVNCKGTMGKGIALEFKKRFPESFLTYKQACDSGKLRPGTLLIVQLTVQPDLLGNKRPAVILFPTKNHWLDKSRIEWIDQGLIFLKEHYRTWGLKSIAMPQIGCGLGGLDWEQVKPLIEKYFKEEKIEIEVYLSAIYDYNEK